MRKLIVAFTLSLAVAIPAAAQKINLDFPGLADRASQVTEVTLDASMLRMAARFLSGKDPDERAVRDMIGGLTGIYVRSFEFDGEGEYDRNLVTQIRSQLGSSWKPFVNVRSKTKENVTIMADMHGDKVTGLVVIAAEPREFTVVSIEGPIDIDRLADLSGEFGIPDITIEKKGKKHD